MKKLLLFLLLAMVSLGGFAQEITIKSITYLENDLEARRNPVLDNNGNPCAYVRILAPRVQGMEFKGIKGEAKYQAGEYGVYVPERTKRIKFHHEKYQAGTIEFTMPIEKQCVYQVVLEVPIVGDSYEDLFAIAKEYYENYPSHTESAYYDAARIAYENVIKHNDCPQDMRNALRAEHDTMAVLRRSTYLVEAAEAKVKQYETEKGFSSEEVGKYLGGEIAFVERILKAHPEIKSFVSLRDSLNERLKQWTKSRTISGKISFENEAMAFPFETMKVYASSSKKIKNAKVIGKVKADGTYSVVKPNGMNPLYIYVTGEKDDAHYVAPDKTVLDIIVKD